MKNAAFLVLATWLLSLTLAAQQANSMASTLDVNGSSASGMAPYAASIELPGPLVITVSGGVDLPFVLYGAAGISVGQSMIESSDSIDIGPTIGVLVNGLEIPNGDLFGFTGASGSAIMQVVVPGGSTTGSVVLGTQALIIDFSAPTLFALSAASSVTFTPDIGTNSAPFCDAGQSFEANTNACYSLDGQTSADPEGNPLTYTWTQVGGTTVTVMNAGTATPSFFAPAAATTLVFELVVNDGVQDSAADLIYVPVVDFTPTMSFSTDIYPIFAARTCDSSGCHDAGTASGGQVLDGTVSDVYSVLMTESMEAGIDGPRADACSPMTSAVAVKPLASGMGGFTHGGGDIFADTSDADYIKILTWLQEGAQNN